MKYLLLFSLFFTTITFAEETTTNQDLTKESSSKEVEYAKPPTSLDKTQFVGGIKTNKEVSGKEVIKELRLLPITDVEGTYWTGEKCIVELKDSKNEKGEKCISVMMTIKSVRNSAFDEKLFRICPNDKFQRYENREQKILASDFKPIKENYTGESVFYEKEKSLAIRQNFIGFWRSNNFPGSVLFRRRDSDCLFTAPLF